MIIVSCRQTAANGARGTERSLSRNVSQKKGLVRELICVIPSVAFDPCVDLAVPDVVGVAGLNLHLPDPARERGRSCRSDMNVHVAGAVERMESLRRDRHDF